MKVRYKGNAQYEFFIPGIPGLWKKGEIRELPDKYLNFFKNKPDFEIIKEKKEKEE
ncbi:MAG: hypothetical protein NC901_03205 [Candidatus Omnitrophica bacterium]|nr:hypothetical protein [Candidatus Omnitrophota bacterium]